MIPSQEYQKRLIDCAKEIHRSLGIQNGSILISGATGLIGSAIVDSLLRMNDEYGTKFNVIALAKGKQRAIDRFGMYFERNDFRFIACDVNKPLPEVGGITYLIHAASNTHPVSYSTDPIGTIRTNVIGTESLLEYARNHGCKRFVFLSSVEIYGENQSGKDSFGETDFGYLDCNQLRSGYPESKRVGESLCCAYRKTYGMDIVIARLCRAYGPTMGLEDSKALAQFIKKAVDYEDIVLKSDGQQYYSYIYVLDAVAAILFILDRGESGAAYNVSSKLSDIRLCDLAQKLAELAGKSVVFELPDEVEKRGYSTATRAILDNTKLKALGWKEMYDIEKGLAETVQVLREVAHEQEKCSDTAGKE